MTLTNLSNFLVRIVVQILDFFEEALVLLHCNLLLFNAGHFFGENLQLGTFAVDFCVTLLIVLSEFGNVLVTCSHLLRILVKEHSILDQTLLKFVILFTKLSLACLELKLLLSEVLFLG